MNKHYEHLRNLLFNDCMCTHQAHMNHNAMDRSCVYDRFLEEVASPIFNCHFNVAKDRYEKYLANFPNGYWRTLEEAQEYIEEVIGAAYEFVGKCQQPR